MAHIIFWMKNIRVFSTLIYISVKKSTHSTTDFSLTTVLLINSVSVYYPSIDKDFNVDVLLLLWLYMSAVISAQVPRPTVLSPPWYAVVEKRNHTHTVYIYLFRTYTVPTDYRLGPHSIPHECSYLCTLLFDLHTVFMNSWWIYVNLLAYYQGFIFLCWVIIYFS